MFHPTREFGTCFFEQYAQISLSALLGSEFDCLVNRDRPDLQSVDNHSIGIEVTRAMEESKRAGNGFYGHFDKMGLYVFCRENLDAQEAVKAMNYTIQLQKYLDIRYNRLYLADVDDLFVCNLDDGLKDSSRLIRYPITQDQRQVFYHEAVLRQHGKHF